MTNLSSNSKIALFSSQNKFNQAHMTIENILLETTLLLHKTISIYKKEIIHTILKFLTIMRCTNMNID